MGCPGVCDGSVDKYRQLPDNPPLAPPPRPLPAKPRADQAGGQNKDTVVKGKAGQAQGLAEFTRSLGGSKRPKQGSGQQDSGHTASKLMRDIASHQPEVAGHSSLDIGLHVGEGVVTVAEHVLEIAGASTASAAAGFLGAGLFVVNFVRGWNDSRIEGDRRVLRAAIAEGAARTLTEICYPGRTDDNRVAEGRASYRNAQRLGNLEGNPEQAYALGERVVREKLAGRSPEEIQAVKEELVALMPGYRQWLKANDRPDAFQRALMEHLNTDVAGRRVGH